MAASMAPAAISSSGPSPQELGAHTFLPLKNQSGNSPTLPGACTELLSDGGDTAANDPPLGGEREWQGAGGSHLSGGARCLDSGMVLVPAPVSDNALEVVRVEACGDADDGGSENENSSCASDEDSSANEESYGSASDRTAASSICSLGACSPVGSFQTPVLMLPRLNVVQRDALMRLNEMHSGLPSLDISLLLENSSKDDFRRCVGKIAERKKASEDDEAIRSILEDLLPLVSESVTLADSVTVIHDEDALKSSQEGSRSSMAIPVAKLIDEDDIEEVEDAEDSVLDEHHDNDPLENMDGNGRCDTELNGAERLDGVGMDSLHAGGLCVGEPEDEHPPDEPPECETPEKDPVFPDTTPSVQRIHKISADNDKPYTKSGEERTEGIDNFALAVEPELCRLNSKPLPAFSENKTEENGHETEPNEEGGEVKWGIQAMEGGDETKLHRGETESGTDAVLGRGAGGVEGETDATKLLALEVEDGATAERIGEPKSKVELETTTETVGESKAKVELGTTITEALDVCQASKLDEMLREARIELEENVCGHPKSTLGTEVDCTECQDQGGGGSVTAPFVLESETEPSIFHAQTNGEGILDADMELQFGSRLPGTCKEPDAEVKAVQVIEEDGTLYADAKQMTVPQQCLDSLVSDLAHGCEDSDDNSETDEDEDDVRFMEGSGVLSALMHSAGPAEPNTETPSLGGPGLSPPTQPIGLGASMPSLEHAPRAAQHTRNSGASSSRSSVLVEDKQLNGEIGDGNKETREKLQTIRVKFLRLAHRLGQSAHNVVVSQVLYRLSLAEQLRGGHISRGTGAFNFERANAIAEEQEAAGEEELDFNCTIMVLGKTGVGKSATINSIFDEVKSGTDAFSPATKKVKEITGNVLGIKLRVIDTPGLHPCFADQRHNKRTMSSVKRFIRKSPPDIVLYFDRLDMQSRDNGDLPLLRTITDTFGAAIWFNAIVVLTHASSAPPDGASGTPLSYEMFVAQRSHVVQQTIRQAAGDMRLMNPVSLVENHPACRINRSGQRVLPNGQVWKPQLLLLCFASKILAEANSLLKLQDSSPGRSFGVRARLPPLPFLLSSLLQSRSQLKAPEEQMGDDDASDEELDGEPESDDEIEYEELPPFRHLTKDELTLIDREQRKAYFEELDYREKLFQKKQWKEELRRRREMRKRKAASSTGEFQPSVDFSEEENSRSAAVPVPMPDMVLPPSFDSDNPSHRYRYLETASQWLVRPVLETHGWDHDSGYDGFNMEKAFMLFNRYPASLSGQITKDKKEGSLQMEGAASFKHGEGKETLCGVDVQTVGKDLAYTLRSETRFNNFRRNKTTGGLAVTFLGNTVSTGMKLEDRLLVGKRLKLVLNGGAITGRGDAAYGGSFEATLRDKDFPIGCTLTTLGLSIMNWHGDLAIGGNLLSQFMIGKIMVIGRGNLNNRGSGQISIRISSSEQLQIALIGFVPIMQALIGNRLLSFSQSV